MKIKVLIRTIFITLNIIVFFKSSSQSIGDEQHKKNYEDGFKNIFSILINKKTNFRDAVFVVENCFHYDSISQSNYKLNINLLRKIIQKHKNQFNTIKYNYSDSTNYLLNLSISKIILDTIKINNSFLNPILLPYTYNHADPFGNEDFTNTFVTKLLQTHKGNCRSLAYLYKILADELGAKCWLSLAPNHIYIKNYSQKIGWYNTELTSGTFPTDAWIMTTGYVNPEAIKTGMYMDTLSNQQAIALCVLDLAKGYERQTKNYYDGFILKCCDLVLQYHPVNPMALLLKAETLKKVYLHEKEIHFPKPTVTESQMTEAYITLAKLGYREMSDKMYQKWLKSINEQKERYSNKKVAKPLQKK